MVYCKPTSQQTGCGAEDLNPARNAFKRYKILTHNEEVRCENSETVQAVAIEAQATGPQLRKERKVSGRII